MKLKDKLQIGFTGTLVFLNPKGEYFSSMEFVSVKTEVQIVYVLRTIVQRKLQQPNLLLNYNKKDLLRNFKGFTVLTEVDYKAKNKV